MTKLFFCIVITSFFWSSCKNDIKKVNAITDKSILDAERAEDVTLFYSKLGKTKAKLSAKIFQQVHTAKPPYINIKNGLRVEFFDDNMNTTSVLTAKSGRYFEEQGNVLVRDSVEIKNQKNEVLRTEELIWSEKLQKFFTEKFVTITTPTQVIYGDGMEANQDFSIYKVLNPRGTILVNNNKLPK